MEMDILLSELVEIGRGEGFLTNGDKQLCGNCGYRKKVQVGETLTCKACGKTQNPSHFDETYRHIRCREIGEKLNELGGKQLMQECCLQVSKVCGSSVGRELEAAWTRIGSWLG